MKKAFDYGLTGLVFAWTITSMVYGQKLRAQPLPEKIIPESKQSDLTKDSGFIFRNEISSKAVRNFIREYKNVTDAEWSRSANGLFVVHFTSDSINITIHYNKNGDCEFLIRNYSEEKLPREIRHLVKSNYYDFSIYHVTEVIVNEIPTYVVLMADKNPKNKTYWKIIRVVKGEMDVMKEFSGNKNDDD